MKKNDVSVTFKITKDQDKILKEHPLLNKSKVFRAALNQYFKSEGWTN